MTIVNIFRLIAALVLGICVIGTFVSFCAVVMGLVLTARRRKPDVSLLSAIASRNVIFRPELYDDEGQRWARLHRLGFVGIFVSIVVGGVASLCLEALLD